MLVVVSDSSPIIYLTRLGEIELLHKLHDRVIIPPAVWKEIVIGGQGLPESKAIRSGVEAKWIEVLAPSSSTESLGPPSQVLGAGEVEAILLAKELGALIITDDSDARSVAEAVGVKVSGTIGVLVRARKEGQLSAIKPLLEKLQTESNFRMSQKLFQDALKAAGEVT